MIKALKLYPISYLVTAARPMENEDITSTAISRVAKYNSNEGSWMSDADEDGVITKEIVTFKVLPDEGSTLAVQSTGYIDDVPRIVNTEKPAGNSATPKRTSDDMNLGLWIAAMIGALACLLLLLFKKGVLRNPLPALGAKIRSFNVMKLPAPLLSLFGAVKELRPGSNRGKHARRKRR